MVKSSPSPNFDPDRPIERRSEDRYGRAALAERVSLLLTQHSDSRCLVIGVNGAWGSGKTSFLNMVRDSLSDSAREGSQNEPIVIDFNPWLFRDAPELTGQFFRSLQRALGDRDRSKLSWKAKRRLGQALEIMARGIAVGEFSPVGSNYFAKSAGILTRVGSFLKLQNDPRRRSLETLRDDISTLLNEMPHRVLVFIDDIDRLEPEAASTLFQVVRLNASFDNVTYVLAFHRSQVEGSIHEFLKVPGAEYLEKIIQLSIEIPPIDQAVMHQNASQSIGVSLGIDLTEAPYQYRWDDLIGSGLFGLINTPRRLATLRNSIGITYGLVEDEVDPVDFVGIEALRLFDNPVYEMIHANRPVFLGPANALEESLYRSAERPDSAESHFERGNVRRETRTLVRHLFPQIRSDDGTNRYDGPGLTRLRISKNIASHEFFYRYFLFGVAAGDVAESELRRAQSHVSTADAENVLGQMAESGRLSRFLDRAVDHTSGMSAVAIEAWVIALANVGDILPDIDDRAFMSDPNMEVVRLIHRMVLRYKDVGQPHELLLGAVQGAAKLGTLTRYVATLSRRDDRDLTDEPLTGDELDHVKQELTERLKMEFEAGRLGEIAGEHLEMILLRWADWTDIAEPAAAVEEMIQSTAGIITLISGFKSSVVRDGRPLIRRDYIHRKNLGGFTNLNELDIQVQNMLNDEAIEMSGQDRSLLELYLSEFNPETAIWE